MGIPFVFAKPCKFADGQNEEVKLMCAQHSIPPAPLSRKGKMYVAFIATTVVLLWLAAFRAATLLPATIPQHFDFQGHPTSYGGKAIIWIIAASFSLVPLLFLALIRWRFVLLERYPYFLSLPAFFVELQRFPRDQWAFWVNRYFELLAALGFWISLTLLVIEVEIFFSMAVKYTPPWLSLATIIFLLVLMGIFFVQLRRLATEMRQSLEKSIRES